MEGTSVEVIMRNQRWALCGLTGAAVVYAAYGLWADPRPANDRAQLRVAGYLPDYRMAAFDAESARPRRRNTS